MALQEAIVRNIQATVDTNASAAQVLCKGERVEWSDEKLQAKRLYLRADSSATKREL